jgi:hypothetical protein
MWSKLPLVSKVIHDSLKFFMHATLHYTINRRNVCFVSTLPLGMKIQTEEEKESSESESENVGPTH